MFSNISRRLVFSYICLLSLLSGIFIVYLFYSINAIAADPSDLPALRLSIIIAAIITFAFAIALTTLFSYFLIRPLLNLSNKILELSSKGASYQRAELEKTTRSLEREVIYYVTNLQKELQTQRSERIRLEEVLERVNDGIILVGADGSIQFLNRAARKLFSVTEDHDTEKSLVKVCRHHAIVDLWRDALLSGESHHTLVELPSQQLTLQVIGIPLNGLQDGSTLLIFQDITQLRYLETIRRDFISNISHELRTPLASLKALTETLQDSISNDPPAARRFLLNIETEVDSLTLLVQELLELARIESGKVPLHLELITPAGIINSAVSRLWLQAERKNLTVKLELPPELPEILADPVRLEQVVVNLIHNAIKFTPPGGEIKISAHDDSTSLIVTVEDNGVGISDKDLPRIFERFYKVDRARSGGGTGLGLAIARHLVEAHRGQIWAESQEGKGSKFYFSLPLSKT